MQATPENEVVARLQAFFAERLTKHKGGDSVSNVELREFGRWLLPSIFGAEWTIKSLTELLEFGIDLKDKKRIVETLNTLLESHPAETASAFEKVLSKLKDSWDIERIRQPTVTLLKAMRKGGGRTEQSAMRIIDQLGAQGHLEFRELLE